MSSGHARGGERRELGRAAGGSSVWYDWMKVTMTHNPACGTSRNVLALLRERGIEPTIIEYLKTPVTRDEIAALVKQMKVPMRDVVRTKEALYFEHRLESASDGELLDALAEHPVLLNRPIVTTEKGAKLCRPSETVTVIL
jgi:arsenate reductase